MRHGLASLHELGSVYSLPDALDMGEIVSVDNYNVWAARNERGRR